MNSLKNSSFDRKKYEIAILNDKYFKKYENLVNYSFENFKYINRQLLFNYINHGDNLCNININMIFANIIYKYIQYKSNFKIGNSSFNYQYLILNKLLNEYKYNLDSILIITSIDSIITGISLLDKPIFADIYLLYDRNKELYTRDDYFNDIRDKFNKIKNVRDIYSFFHKQIYCDTLLKLKNDELPIIKKYEFVSCHFGYLKGLSIASSYTMLLNLPHIIGALSISLKSIKKNGKLIIFLSIININVPSVRKIILLLCYVFGNVKVVSDDINQNFFLGVPEYYIVCDNFKDNVDTSFINDLIDIAIDSTKYVYDICDAVNYYIDYSKKQQDQCLFYKYSPASKMSKLKNKSLRSSKSIKGGDFSISKFLQLNSNVKKTKKTLVKKSTNSKSIIIDKIVKIQYLEDINLKFFDIILNDPDTQYKSMIILNQLETIYINFYEKVANMITNFINIDENGIMTIPKEIIAQTNMNNIRNLINLYISNDIPYNKHILNILKEEEDEYTKHFYDLDNTINYTLIKYNDHSTKALLRDRFTNFKKCNGFSLDILNTYFENINLAYRVKENILTTLGLDRAPKIVRSAYEDFTRGMSDFISTRYGSKLPTPVISNAFVKLWEIFTIFDDLIPNIFIGKINNSKFRTFHICEAPGQMILSTKYFIKNKRKNIVDHDWYANSLNPYNKENITKYGKPFADNYNLMKNNPKKWIWGSDDTGDITKINNIKWYRNFILGEDRRGVGVDLIIGDGGLDTELDSILLQKLDLAQVIMVLACSRIGGSCVIKHFTPYIKRYIGTYKASGFFIGFLYLYYIAFQSVSLFKPYSSNPDSGEFYVIGEKFTGIDETDLEYLYKILDKFELNQGIIPLDSIPETFLLQIDSFLEKISKLNTMATEKQNLLLTCYKFDIDEKKTAKNKEHDIKIEKYLKCNNFLDPDNLQTILVARFNSWIKKYKFC